MAHLTRQSVEQCIMAAYNQYLTTTQGTIVCATTDNGNVSIQCVINGTRFNCGFAGFDMSRAEVTNLRQWCITHPGAGWNFGFRGTDPTHPDSINITLINRTVLMFNFHVFLY
ncbi:hypothetical protein [Pedobacter metabolipauper]|uniref:Uncharacterized protein n=1 Tax=Pedobacter metabolipauper TaxID=425513 RepID=A0A4R6SUL8_9SPHI|nr:hypothetical protein [Pedobacter metabolipauper]TDQ08420.1 hypothetical protein ATK78_2933 [Pedobacter metabolipauper]